MKIIIAILLAELFFKPRVDATSKKIILWYGLKNRKYIILWTRHI